MTLRLLDCFAGIGGFSYAAEHLVGGFTTTQFVELDPYCQRVLAKHWPDVPIHDDIRTFTAPPHTYDVITAGFPCQDISLAGKQAGLAGERSGLFYQIIRLARELQPKFVVLENVANLVSHADGTTFQEVLYALAKAGFDAEWAVIPASDVGACHKRARIWIVAYASQLLSDGSGDQFSRQPISQTLPQPGDALSPGTPTEPRQQADCGAATSDPYNAGLEGRQPVRLRQHPEQRLAWAGNPSCIRLNPDWRTYVPQPVLRRGDDGLQGRVDRLRALGNAVVPHCAAVPLSRVVALSRAAAPQRHG